MPLLGAHLSIAGGYHKAVDAAGELGMETVQIFTKNNNQWRAKELTDDDAGAFVASLKTTGVAQPLAHASYLINLGSFSDDLWTRSIEAMVVELERAARLKVGHVVLHPGSHADRSEDEGVARVVAAIDQIHERLPKRGASKIALETTAGQGSSLGWRFEHLGAILSGVADSSRLGVCVDTCHIFAAGYPIIDRKDYLKTFRDFDRIVGIDRIVAFHLNDSKKDFGSRVDRHEHIGRGKLGLEPFRHVLNDKRFRDLPMCLETPKGTEGDEDLDAINLRTLRGLME